MDSRAGSVTHEVAVAIPRKWKAQRKANIVVKAPSSTACSEAQWSRSSSGKRKKRPFIGFTLSCTYSSDSGASEVLVSRRGKPSLSQTISLPAAEPQDPSLPSTSATAVRDLGDPTDYAFFGSNPKKPAGWDPCTPVDVRINLNGIPDSEVPLVQTAIDRTAAATGLTIRVVGASTTVPTTANSQQVPAETGIVFAFADAGSGPSESDYFTQMPNAAAVAGSTRVDGYTEYAWVVARKSVLDYSGGPDGLRVAIYMHELGHAMGLDHAKTVQQIMYPTIGESQLPAVWGAGDSTGLGLLGKIACHN